MKMPCHPVISEITMLVPCGYVRVDIPLVGATTKRTLSAIANCLTSEGGSTQVKASEDDLKGWQVYSVQKVALQVAWSQDTENFKWPNQHHGLWMETYRKPAKTFKDK